VFEDRINDDNLLLAVGRPDGTGWLGLRAPEHYKLVCCGLFWEKQI